MSLWVPPALAAKNAELSRQAAAEYLHHVELHDQLRRWNRELKRIDPYLQLVKAREDSSLPGLKPGYFHVLRHNPTGPPSLIVHQGPNGEFREPDSGLFEELRKGDMWSERSMRERKAKERELARAEAAEKEREAEERRQEIAERYRHRMGTQVFIK